jgi:hypothetical protein
MDEGALISDGASETVIAKYIKSVSLASDNADWERSGTGRLRFHSIQIRDSNGQSCTQLAMGNDLCVHAAGKADKGGLEFNFAIQLATASGVLAMWSYDQLETFRADPDGKFSIEIRVPELLLMPGSYLLHVWAGRAGLENFDYVKNATPLEMVQSDRIPVTDTVTNQSGLLYARPKITQLRSH